MKKIFFILTSMLVAVSAFSQIEKVEIDGKSYYVYPYQAELRDNSRYNRLFYDSKEVLTRDDKNQKIVNVTIEEVVHTEREKRDIKEYNKYYKTVLDHSVEEMCSIENNLYRDITPTLEKLPDGDYVQYYRDAAYVEKRVLRYKNDVVAGKFTIKNNQLSEGSIWYDLSGNIIRQGNYENGSKFGVWSKYSYDLNWKKLEAAQEALSKTKPKEVVDFKFEDYYDTSKVIVEFKNGIKDGIYYEITNQDTLTFGSYYNNNEANTWIQYGYKEVKTEIEKDKGKKALVWAPTDEKILLLKYTINTQGDSRGKSRMFRERVVDYSYDSDNDYYGYYDEEPVEDDGKEKFYFRDTLMEGDGGSFRDFSTLYSVAIQKEDLDLPQEDYNSFGGAEGSYPYNPYYDYEDEEKEESDSLKALKINYNDITVMIEGKRYLLNHVIDSIGYHFHYEGEFVQYHKNGQLKFRYIIENGRLVEESPVYFDNGQVANLITFNPETKTYTQEYFDYYGKKYKSITYNELGKAKLDENKETEEANTIKIDGLVYDLDRGSSTLNYSAYKEFKKGVTARTLVERSLWKYNKAVESESYFDPETRVLTGVKYDLSGKVVMKREFTFNEDYSSVTGTTEMMHRNMVVKVLFSGSEDKSPVYFGMVEEDSTLSPHRKVTNINRYYDLTTERSFFVDGVPFSGKIEAKINTRKYKLKANEKMVVIHVPKIKRDNKMYKKVVSDFSKGKQNKYLDLYTGDISDGNQFTNCALKFIDANRINSHNFTDYQLDTAYYKSRKGEFDDYEGRARRAKSLRSEETSITGAYINGQAAGPWKIYDQFKHILSDMNYVNGEYDGNFTLYDKVLPPRKPSRKELKLRMNEYYYDEDLHGRTAIPAAYRDSIPSKATYYVKKTATFTHGELTGWLYTYNWLGEKVKGEQYVDGRQNGQSFTKNKLVYVKEEYEDGMKDGLSRAWITPVDRDSILIYELNYQNGALQGKCLNYHTNGKIAKKGFFLSGQPIDDYEAYDTLGNLYQFVKFQYNQPIQEKIWEENQLSVLYEFDWKDSVVFNTSDIIGSTSLSRLLDQLGFRDGSLYAPYLGRPSVLNKEGVNYKMTKYYPNDTIARTGQVSKGKKVGEWNYYNYYGTKLMTVKYFDTLIVVNDTLKFNSKGVLTYVDAKGDILSKNWIIEKFEKYDCAHTDHNEERMLYCFWEKDTNQHRINGYNKNYYDNGSIQNEGVSIKGLPNGIWKMYDVDGRLSQVGSYINGKREGRWLSGDLGDVKNMSEICLNPNLENLDEILKYQENLLDISVVYYQNGKEIRREYYGINKNNGDAPDGFEEDYYDDYYYEGE